ncbi:O-acetylhomoserine aminocarboxypropyltransferase/cysteine synthase family protein [Gemmobacter lanyuensis]
MTETRPMGFDTLAIHAGAHPDPATGARQVPIYQTTAYVFKDADHAARLFNLQEVGYIYSRLTNPTVGALAERVAALEGGAGAVCCSSGHAAQIMALFPLMGPGCNVVASTRLYGGTIQQFSNTIRKFGWSAKFVDFDDAAAIEAAIDDNTRAIFCETIANPGGVITDLDLVAGVANKAGLPLIVDNTTATPYLCKPIEHGATLVVHSATKYLTGNGTVTGGVVVDRASSTGPPRASSLACGAGTGLSRAELPCGAGGMAFTFHSIAVGLRDLGMTMNPQGAHYTLMGIETLGLRMQRHIENARKVAEWLEADPRVDVVTYAGLASSPYHDRVARIVPKGPGRCSPLGSRAGMRPV